MHRSIPFSEIFSSTFSDDLNRDAYDSNVKDKFIAKIGIGLIEFMLSSVFLCYGIIFSECVNLQYYTVENGLWTTILYSASWNITGPWSREICEYLSNKKHNAFRYFTCTAAIILSVGLVIPGQMLSYGVFGGVCSNLIYTQLKFMATENYDMDIKAFEGNIQVARALNLLLMPHFILLLVSYYTAYQVKFILAAFLLNILPAVLMIKVRNTVQRFPEINRYSTLPVFSNQIREMLEFTNSVNISDHNTSLRSSPIEDQENETERVSPLSEEEFIFDININNDQLLLQSVQLTPLTVQTYYQKAGVSILPEIPEEKESELDDINNISQKRLSKISTKLEELNKQERLALEIHENNKNNEEFQGNNLQSQKLIHVERRDSIKEILNINDLISNSLLEEPERIQNIEYIPNYSDSNPGFLRSLSRAAETNFCCDCSPYKKFIWKRRFLNIANCFIDNIFKPGWIAFKDLHFYPALISKVVTNVIFAIFITLTPYVASEKNSDLQPEDATFLLSSIAFSWCLFLVLLPLVRNFSHGKLRLTFICGLILAGTSMTLLSRKMTNDIITISCLLYGFGCGAISYSENVVYRSFTGARKWNLIEGTLETTSALLMILTYYIIYHFNLELKVLLLFGFASYYLIALLWLIAPIFKNIIICLLENYHRSRSR